MSPTIHRTANWCMGSSVWLCAALIFPLQLGRAGAPAPALLVYIAIAGVLLLTADILHDPESYRGKGNVRAQFGPFALAIAVPAALAFAFGQALAPLNEAAEEDQICELVGLSSSVEGSMRQLDDSFDPTADCVHSSEG